MSLNAPLSPLSSSSNSLSCSFTPQASITLAQQTPVSRFNKRARPVSLVNFLPDGTQPKRLVFDGNMFLILPETNKTLYYKRFCNSFKT